MDNICNKFDASVLQQLYKIIADGTQSDRKKVYPVTLIQSIFDGLTGIRLDQLLALNNNIWVPFNGTREATRLQISAAIRRKGLIVSFVDYDNVVYCQRYMNDTTISDEQWKDDANWEECFVSLDNTSLISQLKQYIDDKLKNVVPPEGYEYVLMKKK